MQLKVSVATLTTIAALSLPGIGVPGIARAATPSALTQQAMSANRAESTAAIAQLRAQGPQGLQRFLDTYSKGLNAPTSPDRQRLRATLDQICEQRDCYASRLYWYTDFTQAKAAAQKSGKPILSLRLLGNLDDELSCANSRFFRVALYANADISQYLRDRYILHWQSVRPAPKITIDFGNGRKLERTITGNSIHYIVNATGQPIDALPGLYGPQAFLRHLQQAETTAQAFARLKGADSATFLRQYHQDQLATMQASWAADLAKLGITLPTIAPIASITAPTAEEASRLAMSKMVLEAPLVRMVSSNRRALEKATDEATAWTKLAELHAADARLDNSSKTLMRNKNLAYAVSNQKATDSDPLVAIVRNFESTMALDTVRNEYLLRGEIHKWFVSPNQPKDLEALNQRVYIQLFLTPNSDPWLGLAPENAYSAIENDGIAK